jgi:hypothetical protein
VVACILADGLLSEVFVFVNVAACILACGLRQRCGWPLRRAFNCAGDPEEGFCASSEDFESVSCPRGLLTVLVAALRRAFVPLRRTLKVLAARGGLLTVLVRAPWGLLI